MKSLPQWGRAPKRSEFFFDDGEELADGGPVLLPGEVDGDAGLLVAGAHPEIVGGNGANFGDEEMRGDLVAEALDGEDGFDGVLTRDEVFGLQLFAGAGSEAHAEVRETLVPGAEDAHLLGAVFGGERGDGMKIFGGEFCAEKFRLGVKGLAFFGAGFEPDFAEIVVLPVGEEADAVGAGLDGVEMVFHGGEGEVFVDELAHLVGGLDVESDSCDDAKRAEADDSALEEIVVFLAREFHYVA